MQCLFVRHPAFPVCARAIDYLPRDPFTAKILLSIGDSFDSYSELKDRVREFERANHTQVVHRDSQTLTAAKKRAPKGCRTSASRKPELLYYSIHLTCFGGKKYKQESTGVKPRQR